VLLLATKIAAAPTRTDYHLTFPINNATGTIYKTQVELPPELHREIPQLQTTHPIRASKTISEEALRQYLQSKGSPLGDFTGQLLQSPFWSTIIAITAAEQSFSKNPQCWNGNTRQLSNNLYGMMKPGGERAGIRCFDSIMDGWNYMDDWFEKVEPRRPTIESLRGYYCASACLSWEPTVLRIKNELESL